MIIESGSTSKLLRLVENALADASRPDRPLSSILEQAIRIAHQNEDYGNLAWLELETIDYSDSTSRNRTLNKVRRHLSPEDFATLKEWVTEAYTKERAAEFSNMATRQEPLLRIESVAEMEQKLSILAPQVQKLREPTNPFDEVFYSQADRHQLAENTRVIELGVEDYRAILARIRRRVHDFLTTTERQVSDRMSKEGSKPAGEVLQAERATDSAALIRAVDELRNWFTKADRAVNSPPIDRRGFEFVQSESLSAVLAQDYVEAQLAFSAGAHKASALLSAGVIESMLLDALQSPDVMRRPDYGQAVDGFPQKAGTINWDRVGMTLLIKGTEFLNLLQSAPSRMAEGARDLRDTIHPNAEVRLGGRANVEEAELLLVLVRLIYRDLSRRPEAAGRLYSGVRES